MADVVSVGVNLDAFSHAISGIQALRSSVSRVFESLKDGMKNRETLEGREKTFLAVFQDNLQAVNRDLNELERLSGLVGRPSESHPLHNSGLLSLDPVQDKTPLYSQLLQAYKWSNKSSAKWSSPTMLGSISLGTQSTCLKTFSRLTSGRRPTRREGIWPNVKLADRIASRRTLRRGERRERDIEYKGQAAHCTTYLYLEVCPAGCGTSRDVQKKLIGKYLYFYSSGLQGLEEHMPSPLGQTFAAHCTQLPSSQLRTPCSRSNMAGIILSGAAKTSLNHDGLFTEKFLHRLNLKMTHDQNFRHTYTTLAFICLIK
ncbi:mediator of RNA polymerase II transcription subunit 27 isoform X1 [Stigmatopora nigra]